MLFAAVASALAAFAQGVRCTPLSNAVAASFADSAPPVTVRELSATSSIGHRSFTPPSASFERLDSDADNGTFPATLLLCLGPNCEDCSPFDLKTFPVSECIGTLPFGSVTINQTSNEGLPLGVLVGLRGCKLFAQVPVVNECFNITGGGFSDVALVE